MRIWIVVKTFRGFIQKPNIFLSKDKAYSFYAKLLPEINPDYDEIDIFYEYLHNECKPVVSQH